MRIEANDNPTELSYLDLTNGLLQDIKSDALMPREVKRKAQRTIERLQNLLTIYSN